MFVRGTRDSPRTDAPRRDLHTGTTHCSLYCHCLPPFLLSTVASTPLVTLFQLQWHRPHHHHPRSLPHPQQLAPHHLPSNMRTSAEKKCWRSSPGTSMSISHRIAILTITSRFILNLPEEELASVERVCFQMEQAYAHSTDPVYSVSLISSSLQALVLRGFYQRAEPRKVSVLYTQDVLRDPIQNMSAFTTPCE